MDSKLREAVQIVRRGKKQVTWDAESAKEYNDALALVLDLAESVLAIGAKIPTTEEIKIKGLQGQMKEGEKVKSCPFCGCIDSDISIIDVADREGTPQVRQCRNCGANGEFAYNAKQATENWNRRSTDD